MEYTRYFLMVHLESRADIWGANSNVAAKRLKLFAQ